MKYFFILFIILISNNIEAQKKLDNFLLLGSYGSYDTIKNPRGGGLSIDFKYGDPIAYRKDRQMPFDRDIAIMCNDTGKLLFYTNGIYVNDARDSLMMNGDSINHNLQILEYSYKYEMEVGYQKAL